MRHTHAPHPPPRMPPHPLPPLTSNIVWFPTIRKSSTRTNCTHEKIEGTTIDCAFYKNNREVGTGGGPLGECGVVGQRGGGPHSRVPLKDPVYAHDWFGSAVGGVCVADRFDDTTPFICAFWHKPGEFFVRFLLFLFHLGKGMAASQKRACRTKGRVFISHGSGVLTPQSHCRIN